MNRKSTLKVRGSGRDLAGKIVNNCNTILQPAESNLFLGFQRENISREIKYPENGMNNISNGIF